MAANHFYWGIKATPAMLALPSNPWGKLLTILEGTPSVPATYDADGNVLVPAVEATTGWLQGQNDFRYDTLQIRHNQDGSGAIYEALFDDANVSVETIRQKLVAAFNLADNRVTVTLSSTRFATRTSAIAAFKLDATIMFRATIFGRSSDSQVVTWAQSLLEVQAYLAANSLEWDGV